MIKLLVFVRSRSLPMVVGLLTAAVLLQGCLLDAKSVLDRYFAVIAILSGVKQELTRTKFSIPGDGYCNNVGSVLIRGQMGNGYQTTPNPYPDSLFLSFEHVDEFGNPLRTAEFNVMVNSDGTIPDQFFSNSIPSGCIRLGEELVVSVRPEGADIAEGTAVEFIWSAVF